MPPRAVLRRMTSPQQLPAADGSFYHSMVIGSLDHAAGTIFGARTSWKSIAYRDDRSGGIRPPLELITLQAVRQLTAQGRSDTQRPSLAEMVADMSLDGVSENEVAEGFISQVGVAAGSR